MSAILVVDVVGFGRLTNIDEDGTLRRFRTLQTDVIGASVTQHNGRIVKWTGDGALVEFRSVVEAVRCAVQIQEAVLERNAGVDDDRRMLLRIGVHLGDVVEEADGDLMGDGVNVAARLESLAAPGAICLSEDAYRFVRSRLEMAITDLGETALKNIAQPMRVYSVEIGTPASCRVRERAADEATRVADGGCEKPSIAVLPFTNMSADAEQSYFVDGMVEDIITALSRFDELFVVARNSTFIYKGRSVDVRRVGRELGVRYVLEGSVRKSGDRVRVTGQLIDAETGAHLWAERYDGKLDDVFELQDEISASVVGVLEPTVRKSEIERARRKPPEHMGAYDLYLQALPHLYVINDGENRTALALLERSIALDADYAPALSHAGWALVQRLTRDWPAYGDDDVLQAVAWARRALAVGTDDAKAVVLGGFTLVMLRQDYAVGMDALGRAIDLNPGSGFVTLMAGSGLMLGDEIQRGLRLIERGMALCPKDPNMFVFLATAAIGHLFMGETETALVLALRSRALNDRVDTVYWVLAAIYDALGRTEDARAAVRALLAVHPQARAGTYDRVLPIRNGSSRALFVEALRRAGLPE